MSFNGCLDVLNPFKMFMFLANKNIIVCPHLPYSSDLVLCGFWLFSSRNDHEGLAVCTEGAFGDATTAQSKTLIEHSRPASESGRSKRISVFRTRRESSDNWHLLYFLKYEYSL